MSGPFSILSNFKIVFILSHMSCLSLKIAPDTYLTPVSKQAVSISSRCLGLSVINGRIGSIFTAQHTPASTNFFIALKIEEAAGVPGSTRRLILSFVVVIDQTKKQSPLYL